ncbi:hypothetical protein DM01DRAFT_1340305 [Hesseltinella vesiculosa]|uniref:Ribosome-binding factor A n=1 Tax=Hesseltinella vesiculosa TaxID=101127 RepID=A0A1X2G4I3_9FUNG|nr:hypothetical protein DM01DRAFT_1340305 [Hesseltinella vesiculosa]
MFRRFTTAVNHVAHVKKARKPQLDHVSDIMIPGQSLHYFRPHKVKTAHAILPHEQHLEVHKESSRPMYEYEAAPTLSQERMASRIHRALSTVYAVEPLPSPLITQAYLSLLDVKVSRNLRKCHVFYEPLSTSKAERGHVHRALIEHQDLLNKLIKQHAQLRKPIMVKFISDTQTKELKAIYDQLEKELGPQ